MLRNDPLRGTLIEAEVPTQKDESQRPIPPPLRRRGTVVQRVTGTGKDDPDDLFDVEIGGQTYRIRRRYLYDLP